ncbi:hypothetical protein BC833DRAFT_588541 [Globomyces pollinis-pini]|nr:hypothetical protein BC833DRAFT_588541 [Globomyces pollinis-pini]
MIDYPIRNPENACNSYINDSEFYSNCLCSKNYHVLNCYNSYCENDTMIEVYKQKVIGCKIPTTSTQVPTASPSTTLNPSYESNPFNIFDYSIGIGLLAVLLIILISMLVFRKSLMKRKASANQVR